MSWSLQVGTRIWPEVSDSKAHEFSLQSQSLPATFKWLSSDAQKIHLLKKIGGCHVDQSL